MNLAAGDSQEALVTLFGSQIRGELYETLGTNRLGQRRCHPGDVASIGHDDHDAPAAREGCLGRSGKLSRPAGAGQRGPGGAGTFALSQLLEISRAVGIARPASRRGRVRRRWQGLALDSFGPGVAGRDREAEHVSESPGPAVGYRPAQPGNLRTEDALTAEHPAERLELAGEFRRTCPAHDHPVDQPPGQANPDAYAGPRRFVHLGRDRIVEKPIQMGQLVVDRDRHHERLIHTRMPTSPATGYGADTA